MTSSAVCITREGGVQPVAWAAAGGHAAGSREIDAVTELAVVLKQLQCDPRRQANDLYNSQETTPVLEFIMEVAKGDYMGVDAKAPWHQV